MKKTILILASAILFLSSCSVKETPTKSSSVVSSLEVVCNVTKISQDVLTYYDVIYNYTDFKGESHTEAITEPRTIKFKEDSPVLVDETSSPYAFTIEVVTQKKEGIAQKPDGEKYNSTLVFEITAEAQYTDSSKEPFSSGCSTRASEWDEAPNFKMFSTVVNNLAVEKRKFNLCLDNSDGVMTVKLVDLTK